MIKRLLLFLMLLFFAAPSHAQTTVSGNLSQITGNTSFGNLTFVRFRLRNFSGFQPHVGSVFTLANVQTDCTTTSSICSISTSGVLSGTINGNDIIQPAGTYYTVEVWNNGRTISVGDYLIQGPTWNLNSASVLVTPPTPSDPILYAKTFECLIPTASQTWTCSHAFGNQDNNVTCYNLSHQMIFPDSVTGTDVNTTVITFTAPQAGSCVISNTGNVSLTSQPANAIIGNPQSPQTIVAQPLNLTGMLNLSGGETVSGPETHSGVITTTGQNILTAQSLNASTIFADQVTPSSGLCGVTGSDASAKIQCAINLLPAIGGTVNALNLTDAGGLGSTVIDPGTIKSVTLLLGPTKYFISQIVLRPDFHILGFGHGQSATDTNSTTLQSCATCGAIDAIVLPQTAVNATQEVLLSHFNLFATQSANTSHGINLVATSGGGLWYSRFENLCIGACGPNMIGFTAGNFVLDATVNPTSGVHQFNDFFNIKSFQTAGGGTTLWLKGVNAQESFYSGEFDGDISHSPTAGTNILIQDGAGLSSAEPTNTIYFYGVTSQWRQNGIVVQGAWALHFEGMHIEGTQGVFQFNSGVINSNEQIHIADSYIVTSGVNAGSGYIIQANNLNDSIFFDNNYVGNVPDHLITGAASGIVSGTHNVGGGGNDSAPVGPAKLYGTQNVGRVTWTCSGNCTNLTTSNIVFGSGWGTSPIINSVRGSDSLFVITLTSGTGSPSANPFITITFQNGSWGTAPICVPASGILGTRWVNGGTGGGSTAQTLTFDGTPAASTQYIVYAYCGGSPN